MHTLSHYNIYVASNQLATLNRNVWSEETVPAYINFGKGITPIRLKYRGAHTRLYDKKSYYIRMNGREWHLNADATDPSNIRSKWSFDLFASLDALSPRATHITVTLNGEYLGVYTILESVDRHFLKRRRLAVGDIFYAVDNRANFALTVGENNKRFKRRLSDGYELKQGNTRTAQRHLEQFIWKLNTAADDHLASWLLKAVDVPSFLRWLVGIVLTSNADGFIHNYALYRHPGTGKWRVIPWDYDGTWGRDCYGRTMSATEIPLFGYNRLTERILAVPAFRRRYVQLMTGVLKHYFTSERLMRQAQSLMADVRPAVYTLSKGRDDIIQQFEKEQAVLHAYVTKRRQFLRKAIARL